MSNKIIVKSLDGQKSDFGCATAIVEPFLYGDGNTEVFILSCLHVLGLTFKNFPRYNQPTEVFIEVGGKEYKIADYSGQHAGNLFFNDQLKLSFDAALAKIDTSHLSLDQIKEHLNLPVISELADFPEEIPPQGQVVTHRGSFSATNFQVRRGSEQWIQYKHSARPMVKTCHRVIVEYDAATQAGDSGSPVYNEQGDMLLGMHIAGDPSTGKGYMIPTIDLLNSTHRFSSLKNIPLIPY